ncbi:26S protease regulatory subunit like protein [Rutstroemia sp. NJR-2017a BVV2]|nr:26S protease regulatory subunit like protein [Rutstroemia sp. NJR-2017a BVV2]
MAPSFEGLANSIRIPSLTRELLCPYFSPLDEVNSSFEFHLNCLMIPGTTVNNPYSSANCFNITFYEIVSSGSRHESYWKMGPLFTDGAILNDSDSGERLRHSAFTVYTKSTSHDPLEPFYTVVLLTPETFHVGDKSKCLFEVTAIESELWCIKSGLLNVVEKWTELSRYFAELLADDFLNLNEYVKLLFDDENFTRSRKYFWAIGCLTEFTNVLADNIKQWDLYYEARIQVLLELDNIEEKLAAASLYPPYAGEGEERLVNFKKSIRECQNHRETLVGLREDFQRKLDSANALRDGLFNASALVESRASTRLGENVKLLTYVSIFYLPLSFCAAIWAIPNVQSSSISMPFIIMAVVVGVVTYAVTLNMDLLNRKLNGFYYPRRQSLINQMQMETGPWKATGAKFEQFKPTSEDKVPTEWWIPLYWIRTVFMNVLGKGVTSNARNDEPPVTVTSPLDQITTAGHPEPPNGLKATSTRLTGLKNLATAALKQVSSLEPVSLKARILEKLGRGQGRRGGVSV